ncbi:MAG: EAL domain-containing protein [Mycobacterium sp.]|uniref:bifunctional diguanylate cyclase/phosphodiesterase n=1 Tax=Mycobacterium sp. TaxID=1785 RepID=UPI001ED5D231|nr:EAL domain-containing protein [Mycobacterium sp.]MBW0017200.1 EAL domain-containing protein [Mycobacterium sp.]
MPKTAPQTGLNAIVTAVATKLMGVTTDTAEDVSTGILADLVGFLGVDFSFLRHNVHGIRATVLVAEWPPRPSKPDPDPLQTIYFADADPIFALCENAKEPVVLRPESANEEYQRTISDASGIPAVSMASVPLLSGDITTGVLGFVKLGDREWNQAELNALTVVATMFAQVQARLNVEDRLSYQAGHDDLTSLPNRRTLLAHLDSRLVAGQPGPVAVLLLNLNRLKAINDYLGHAAGDQFIRDFAAGTMHAVQGLGMAARVGGSQFAVVPALAMDLEDARELAEDLGTRLADHVTIGGEVLNRTVSIGVTTGLPGEDTSLDLLRRADEALLSAKGAGGESIGVFCSDMLSRRELRVDVELHLPASIEADALSLVYLPEVDMRTGKVLAVEALVRWQHPTRGLLLPDAFVPVAESINVAGELGEWVLRTACADLAKWRAQGVGLSTMLRINVSPAHLVAHDLVNSVSSMVEQFGLEGPAIGVEITESMLIRDLVSTRATLHGLADLGVDIAIDDFGTGFSGMGLLRTLPVSTVKIDRGFVRDLDTSADDLSIVRAVIGLAEALELGVVGEGVETEGAARALLDEGCSRAQGFLFCRPIAAEATQRLLAEGSVPISITPTAPDPSTTEQSTAAVKPRPPWVHADRPAVSETVYRAK